MSTGYGKRLLRSDDWHEESDSYSGNSPGDDRRIAGLRDRRTAVSHGTHGHANQDTKTDVHCDSYADEHADPDRHANANQYSHADAGGHQHADRLHSHTDAAAH